jgi:uncharacterized membrane protein YgaE (UPF0421/DUF939 family)
MQNEVEARPHHTPIVRKAFAGVVLVVAVALALKLVIGFVVAIFWTVAIIAIVLAVLWAVKTLVW